MDIKAILNHFDIPFTEYHPEVSYKCVGVDCPFCDDTNKHCGIFLDTGHFSCWKCQESGSLYKLLREINSISYQEYSDFVGIDTTRNGKPKTILDSIFKKEETVLTEKIKTINLRELRPQAKPLQELSKMIRLRTHDFLIKKGFVLNDAIHYNCWYGISGKYQGRLIIPIPPFGETIGFIARDISDMAKSKYVFEKGFKAHNNIYQAKTSQYGIIILVEGIFDVWTIPQPYIGIGIFGKNLSNAQLSKIILQSAYHCIVMLDGDTKPLESKKIADKIRPFVHKTSIINLPKKEDPASIGKQELDIIITRHLSALNSK